MIKILHSRLWVAFLALSSISLGSVADTITVKTKNTSSNSAVIVYSNYATMKTDTLAVLTGENGILTSKPVRIQRAGFYMLRISKRTLPIFLESGRDYMILFDDAAFPAGTDVNGSSQFYTLLHTLNSDWQYATVDTSARVQFGNIEQFYSNHLKLISSMKSLQPKERKIAAFLLEEIAGIMKSTLLGASNDPDISKQVAAELNKYQFGNPLASEVFPEKFLKSRLYQIFSLNSGISPDVDPVKFVKYVASNVSKTDLRDFLVHQYFSRLSREISTTQMDSVLSALKASGIQTSFKTEVKVVPQAQTATTLLMPEILLSTRENKVASTRDYLGKLLLIDVWALWCKPCLAEKPDLDKLEVHYKNAIDFKVLRISIDDYRKPWAKAIAKENYENLWCKGGFESDICTKLSITSIPRYIVVNAKGEVVNIDAPRPSSAALYTLIDRELQQMKKSK